MSAPSRRSDMMCTGILMSARTAPLGLNKLVGALILQTRTDERCGAMDNASRQDDDVAITSAERQHRSAGGT